MIRDTAITLRRLDYSETSQILAVLTREHGRLRVIAKGIKRGTKKRFAPGIDLLEMGELVIVSLPTGERTLATLSEWKQLRGFTALRDKLERLNAAQYASEITARMTEEADPHPELFDGLVNLLEGLCSDVPPLNLVVDFQCLLLKQAGLLPDMAVCASCGRSVRRDQSLYFSSGAGGLLCTDCEPAIVEKRRITAPAFEGLAGGQRSPEAVVRAFDVLDYHITQILGARLLTASGVVPERVRRVLGPEC